MIVRFFELTGFGLLFGCAFIVSIYSFVINAALFNTFVCKQGMRFGPCASLINDLAGHSNGMEWNSVVQRQRQRQSDTQRERGREILINVTSKLIAH